jgi:hypothetical protein
MSDCPNETGGTCPQRFQNSPRKADNDAGGLKFKERRQPTMACITLFAHPMAMATTQLARAIHYKKVSACPMDGNVEHKPLSMSWVVVTDNNGNRKLQIQWAPSEDIP